LNLNDVLKYLYTHLMMADVLVDPIAAAFFLFGRQRCVGHLHRSTNVNSLPAKTIEHTIINCGQNNIIILCFSLFNCFHLSSSSLAYGLYTRVKYNVIYILCRRDLPGFVCKYKISRRQFIYREPQVLCSYVCE